MVGWSTQNTCGVVAAVAINVVPIAVLVALNDSMSKQPVGISAYTLPCNVALISALVSSVVAHRYGRGKPDCFMYYVLFAAAALFIMFILTLIPCYVVPWLGFDGMDRPSV